MTFKDALAIARDFAVERDGYVVIAVGTITGNDLLTEHQLSLLRADKVLSIHPKGFDGFYYWNVAAAMLFQPQPTTTSEEPSCES